jgi:hypothetical protein
METGLKSRKMQYRMGLFGWIGYILLIIPRIVKKGKMLASFPVTVKNGWGSFNTNPYHALQFGKADLGPHSPHKLQAFVEGHVGEIQLVAIVGWT